MWRLSNRQTSLFEISVSLLKDPKCLSFVLPIHINYKRLLMACCSEYILFSSGFKGEDSVSRTLPLWPCEEKNIIDIPYYFLAKNGRRDLLFS
jgi:hypothetical protein